MSTESNRVSAAAVRASIERGDGDLEQIGATVRAALAAIAAHAAEVESDLLTETEG